MKSKFISIILIPLILNLSITCAQLGEVRLRRDGSTFFVRQIATISPRDNCKADIFCAD